MRLDSTFVARGLTGTITMDKETGITSLVCLMNGSSTRWDEQVVVLSVWSDTAPTVDAFNVTQRIKLQMHH